MSPGLAARAVLTTADLLYLRPFLRDANDPGQAQQRALHRILTANAATEFGREHGFGGLATREDFRAAVPVQTHETLSAAIQRQAQTGAAALTAQRPVFYARTSGTTGPARDFPVTAAALAAQRAAQRVLAAALFRGTGFFDGRVAAFGGPLTEGYLPGGQPYGSASGLTYATAPKVIRDRFVVPASAFAITDPARKYHAYALSMLAAEDLTGVITANPSTLLSVFSHIRQNAEAVLRDLSDGAGGAPAPHPARAKALETVLGQGAPPGQVWPRLNTLATWTGGNCRVALDQLMPMLPPVQVAEIGYRASEFIGTINADAARNLCLPDITRTVFEFVEEDRWERGDPEFLWLDQIERDRRYYIFATTLSGLYRYHINDVIQVTGDLGACPALGFVRKGQGMTSITGEKVHEVQVIDAVRQTMAAHGVPPAFFVAIADPQDAVYRLFHEIAAPPDGGRTEQAALAFDAALCRGNIEYAAKRASGRLAPARLVFMKPGCGEAVKRAAVAAGRREAQVKPPALADASRWSFDFDAHRWEGSE